MEWVRQERRGLTRSRRTVLPIHAISSEAKTSENIERASDMTMTEAGDGLAMN